MIQHSSDFGDQSAAGAIMWVRGSIAFLVPAVMLGTQALTEVPLDAPTRSQRSGASRFSVFQREQSWDLLRTPILGPILRYRHFRR
jgi:hypothetical protein